MKLSRTAAVIAVGAVLFAGGCSLNKSTTTPAMTTATADSDATNVPAEVPEFILHNGAKVSGPDTVSVKSGDTVKFTVISDKDDQLHIHGYDKEIELKSGQFQTVEFKATITGKFEIEIHSNDSLVCTLEVR
ncbi:hypothetical protein [Smaragdicoccus niigatensis]|uniref:hypothetical protein n=1 Tax=Smaragdicoccus niigatensis TaxID=359359 RepID=UPI0003701701|nr:hypothetical protein [Smaragdicoccus niigatensis]